MNTAFLGGSLDKSINYVISIICNLFIKCKSYELVGCHIFFYFNGAKNCVLYILVIKVLHPILGKVLQLLCTSFSKDTFCKLHTIKINFIHIANISLIKL